MRAKTKYKSEMTNGRMKFEKAGEGPIQREGIEYEGDMFTWMSDAVLTVDKTRCDRIGPGTTWEKPGAEFAGLLADWIEDAEPRRIVLHEKLMGFVVDCAESGASVDNLKRVMSDEREPTAVQAEALRVYDEMVAKRAAVAS